VWSRPIVVHPPALDDLPGILQADEPVFIETFDPEPAVEAFHIGVLHGLPQLDELQLDSLLVRPGVQGL